MFVFVLQLVASVMLSGCDSVQPVAEGWEDGSRVVGAQCAPDARFPDEAPRVVFFLDAFNFGG